MLEQFFNCTNCGAPINKENNGDYCKFCGAKLPKDEAAPVTNNNVTNNVYNVTNVTYANERPKQQQRQQQQQSRYQTNTSGKQKKFVNAAIIGAAALLFYALGAAASKGPYVIFYIIGLCLTYCALKTAFRSNKCKKCKNDIGYTVKICPYCNHNQNEMSLGAIILTLVLGAILLFVFLAAKVGNP